MKLFGWMQNKFNGRHGSKKQGPVSGHNHACRKEPEKEEFSDWPNGLLAIGTFGNNEIKQDSDQKQPQENASSSNHDHPQGLTPEEVGRFQKELNLLIDNQTGSTCHTELDETANLALIKFLDANKERTKGEECPDQESGEVQENGSVVLCRGRDVYVDKTSNAINKKTLSFLLKKIFVCRSGTTPTLNLKDQLPESRMEKILRAILSKKVYPQTTNSTMSMKKYLGNRKPTSANDRDEVNDQKVDNGSKWVKTDAEYIVLEI